MCVELDECNVCVNRYVYTLHMGLYAVHIN